METRGIRNNNPGNLRYAKSVNWNGLVPECSRKDKAFFEFKNIYWGLRAMMLQIRNYYYRKNKTTIKSMISLYAPPVENNTQFYYDEVAKYCAINHSSTLTPISDLSAKEFEEILPFMILRMCQIESKYTPNIDLLCFMATVIQDGKK